MVWYVAAAFSVAGGLAQASAQRKAGKAARREAQLQAKETRRRKFDIQIFADQQHENAMEAYRETVSTNAAMAAYTGRTGRSLKALARREARMYGRNVDRIRAQQERETQATEREAQAIERGGREAYKSSRRQAAASLIKTAGTAYDIYSDR